MVSLACVTTIFAARQKTTLRSLVPEDGMQVRPKEARRAARRTNDKAA
jgi:hypothetical protein